MEGGEGQVKTCWCFFFLLRGGERRKRSEKEPSNNSIETQLTDDNLISRFLFIFFGKSPLFLWFRFFPRFQISRQYTRSFFPPSASSLAERRRFGGVFWA